jgi:outer membrane protein assembly factor BamB
MQPTWPLPVAFAVLMTAAWAAPRDTTADDARARWPQFRGPGGAGVADGAQPVPVEFGPSQNVLWKTALPAGHSSPVVWGDRIFVTGFLETEKRLETLCLDRSSGRILWRQAVSTESIEKVHEINNPAATTPVTDGETVFVYFGSYGLVAYDFEGRERWTMPLPMARTHRDQGSGTSPILAGDRLLLDVHLGKDSYLLAVHTRDGKAAWKAPKPEFNGGWASPVVWKEGQDTLVGVLNPGRFTAHRLDDGEVRWWLTDLPRQTCATPVAGEGLLYLSASGTQGEADNVTLPPSFDEIIRYDQNQDGRIATDEVPETLLLTDRRASDGAGNMPLRQALKFFSEGKSASFDRAAWDQSVQALTEFVKGPYMQSRVLAVRTGGGGDVTTSHVEWSDSRGVPEVPSPLLYRGRLYQVKNGGIALCRDAKSGAKVFEGRLGAPGGYYASPVAANGRVYVASDAGVVVVFEAQDTLQVLARNDLGEPILATPAVADGALYVRTTSHLYAFAAAATTPAPRE